MLEEFKKKFVDEALDLTGKLERCLLSLEDSPNDSELIDELFRGMHSIKGASGMYGFEQVEQLTHCTESVYQLVREGKMLVDQALLQLSFEVVDALKALLHEYGLDKLYFEGLLGQIRAFMVGSQTQNPAPVETETDSVGDIVAWYILFHPDKNVMMRGINPESLVNQLTATSRSKAIIRNVATPLGEQLASRQIEAVWEIFHKSGGNNEEIDDFFIFFLDDEVTIAPLTPGDLAENKSIRPLVENLFERSTKPPAETIEAYCDTVWETFRELLGEEFRKPDTTTSAAQPAKKVQSAPLDTRINYVKVASDDLDGLMNLVSELVIAKARLEQLEKSKNYQGLSKIVDEVSKLSHRFRDSVLNMRLIPVESLMVEIRRLVRDLSVEVGKPVEFFTEGTETLLDKTIIEQLKSPLVHIIRNSIDHGIEDEITRTKRGKPTRGSIRFVALYSGSSVFLQIQDDGGGIDPARIRQKALQKGLIRQGEALKDKEVFDLIFMPGFSTAEKVTGISGRGVGLDVVRNMVAELRGEIEVDSELGLGTTVTLKLPLTLSIIDALLIRVDQQYFLIQLSMITNCQLIRHEDLFSTQRRHLETDRLVPYLFLREILAIDPANPPQKQKAIFLKHNNKEVVVVADDILGEYQAVIKPLGIYHKRQDLFSGASILGNGKLALILDIAKIIKHASQHSDFQIIY